MLIKISNLAKAYPILQQATEPVHLINAPNTIFLLGVQGVHYMFTKLKQDFNNINMITMMIEDSTPAFFTALSLGYQQLVYTGYSSVIPKIAKNFGITLLFTMQGLE